MATNHTKGKWVDGWGSGLTGPTTPNTHDNPTVDKDRMYIPVSMNKQTIAIVIQPESNSIEEMKANAKIIAASPDMLDALFAAKAVFESQGIDSSHSIVGEQYNQVMNAIKKAIK